MPTALIVAPPDSGPVIESTPSGYVIRVGSQLPPITVGGQQASATVPGGGWQPLGARAATGGYELLWRSVQNDSFYGWTLDAAGAATGGRPVGLAEIRTIETRLQVDIDGDGFVGPS